jgi:hypothetical protein
MLGGKINVQSTVGEGSLFAVQIPQKISKRSNDTEFRNITIYDGNKENKPGHPRALFNNLCNRFHRRYFLLLLFLNKLKIGSGF